VAAFFRMARSSACSANCRLSFATSAARSASRWLLLAFLAGLPHE